MYYRKLFMIFLAGTLVLHPFMTTSCNNVDNADAQIGDPDIPDGSVGSEFLIPVTGHPFVSRADDGTEDHVVGSFETETFVVIDGNLFARGELKGAVMSTSEMGLLEQERLSATGALVDLPVEFKTATCTSLELLIGPPEGLMDPILMTFTEVTSKFKRTHFCNIAQANLAGDNEALSDLLNTTGSCAIYDYIICASAIVACAVVCVVESDTCSLCYSSLGEEFCEACD